MNAPSEPPLPNAVSPHPPVVPENARPIGDPKADSGRWDERVKRANAWASFLKTIATVIVAIVGVVATVAYFLKSRLDERIQEIARKELAAKIPEEIVPLVRKEIKAHAEPDEKYYEALNYFDAGKEEDGFTALDTALELYEARPGVLSKQSYEGTLRTYLEKLSQSLKPHPLQPRFKRILSKFSDREVPLKPEDHVYIGYFQLESGNLQLAKASFESGQKLAAMDGSTYTEASGHTGLVWVSLIEADPQKALRHLETAWELNPYPQGWSIGSADPTQRRYSTIYGELRPTVDKLTQLIAAKIRSDPNYKVTIEQTEDTMTREVRRIGNPARR